MLIAYGVLIVWNMDFFSHEVVKSYKTSDPENPMLFQQECVCNS